MFRTLAGALALVMGTSGCHAAQLQTLGRTGPVMVREERQWFVGAGAIPLSAPAAQVYVNGVAKAEVLADTPDTLLQLGLWAAAALLVTGAAVGCQTVSGADASSGCFAAGALGGALVPFTISSRTVRYVCVEEIRGAGVPDGPVPLATPPYP